MTGAPSVGVDGSAEAVVAAAASLVDLAPPEDRVVDEVRLAADFFRAATDRAEPAAAAVGSVEACSVPVGSTAAVSEDTVDDASLSAAVVWELLLPGVEAVPARVVDFCTGFVGTEFCGADFCGDDFRGEAFVVAGFRDADDDGDFRGTAFCVTDFFAARSWATGSWLVCSCVAGSWDARSRGSDVPADSSIDFSTADVETSSSEEGSRCVLDDSLTRATGSVGARSIVATTTGVSCTGVVTGARTSSRVADAASSGATSEATTSSSSTRSSSTLAGAV
jgi:hypothetical protein